MVKGQAEMLKLVQKHEEKLQRLADKNHKKEVTLLKRQKLKAMEHCLIAIEEIQKVPSSSDVNDGVRQSTHEHTMKAEMEEQIDFLNAVVNALSDKERKANYELEEAQLMGLETLKYLGEKGHVIEDAFRKGRLQKFIRRTKIGIKRAGEINSAPWAEAFQEKSIDEATGAMKLSTWTQRIEDPQYEPFRKENFDAGTGGGKQVIDDKEQHLLALREELGEKVYQTVIVALQEIEEFNPSGRYPLSMPWNFDENKPANLWDVMNHFSLVIEALVRRVPPLKKGSQPSTNARTNVNSYRKKGS